MRPYGAETWHTLRDWDKGQAASERLCAKILMYTGYEDVELIHPLGGRDGKKDAVAKKNGKEVIVSVYFPRGQVSFTKIKNKFKNDSKSLKNDQSFVFFTNQELRLSEREQLKNCISQEVFLFHLEKIANLLDTPGMYGERRRFLDIESSKEEEIAFLDNRDKKMENFQNSLDAFIKGPSHNKKTEELSGRIVPLNDYSNYFSDSKREICPNCKRVYTIPKRFSTSFISNSVLMIEAIGTKLVVECPHCNQAKEFEG